MNVEFYKELEARNADRLTMFLSTEEVHELWGDLKPAAEAQAKEAEVAAKKMAEDAAKAEAEAKKAEEEAAKAAEKDGVITGDEKVVEELKGSLPDDFPGRQALADEGINTYNQLRHRRDSEEGLKGIPGIGAATIVKIEEALKG
jgi:hypothetical protein